jgi:hypothetical protein
VSAAAAVVSAAAAAAVVSAAAVVAAVSGLFKLQPARVVTASAAQTAVPKNLFFIVTSSLSSRFSLAFLLWLDYKKNPIV